MSLFFEDTSRNDTLGETGAGKSLYHRKRCLLDSETTTSSYSVKVAKVDNAIAAENDDDSDYGGLPPPSVDITETIAAALAMMNKPKNYDDDFDNIFFGRNKTEDQILEDLKKQEQPKHIFVTEGIELKDNIKDLVPMSQNQKKKHNKRERQKTKGDGWFNMKAPELTPELKNELTILQMRSALDPKHFYKRSENKSLPKYFEMGKIIESPLDYHNSKNIRQGKHKSMVDELMEDAEFQKFNKKKYAEAMVQKQSAGYNKALKKMRKLKKQNKK